VSGWGFRGEIKSENIPGWYLTTPTRELYFNSSATATTSKGHNHGRYVTRTRSRNHHSRVSSDNHVTTNVLNVTDVSGVRSILIVVVVSKVRGVRVGVVATVEAKNRVGQLSGL